MNNLPPGCSVNDIPGNRPEDGYMEALDQEVLDLFSKHIPRAWTESQTEELYALSEAIVNLILDKERAAYDRGYAEGQESQ